MRLGEKKSITSSRAVATTARIAVVCATRRTSARATPCAVTLSSDEQNSSMSTIACSWGRSNARAIERRKNSPSDRSQTRVVATWASPRPAEQSEVNASSTVRPTRSTAALRERVRGWAACESHSPSGCASDAISRRIDVLPPPLGPVTSATPPGWSWSRMVRAADRDRVCLCASNSAPPSADNPKMHRTSWTRERLTPPAL